MIDISQTTAPKSDQMNADDLIGGPRTITVTRVVAREGRDQPVDIFFEGDGGKPYKPCLSMRRVLMRVWGLDGTAYAGRRMTLYRDDAVQFGGMAVGGIRISHMSDIDREVTMPLTVTKARRAAYTVRPLPPESTAKPKSGRERLHQAAREAANGGTAVLARFREGLTDQQDRALAPILAELERTAAERDDRLDEPDGGRFPGDDTLERMGA